MGPKCRRTQCRSQARRRHPMIMAALLLRSVDRGVPATYCRSNGCSSQSADPSAHPNNRGIQIPEIPAALVGNMFSDPRTHTSAGTSPKGCADPRVSPAPGRTQPNQGDVRPCDRDVLLFPFQADGLIGKANEGASHRTAVGLCDCNLLPRVELLKVLPRGKIAVASYR